MFILGVLEFIFYPDLIYPQSEFPIHQGRKVIDIKFTNAAREGFFFGARLNLGTRAINVFIECKNYSHDPTNPELDQLAGRFAPQEDAWDSCSHVTSRIENCLSAVAGIPCMTIAVS